jgi:membrane fusion protein, multidrug efflux system
MLSLAALGSIFLSLSGCGKNDAAAGPPAGGGFAAPVTAVSAVTQDVPVYLDEIGKAVASQSVTIVPQVSGVVVARHFEDGAEIKRGQLLFEIDPRPFQAQLDQAKGQLAKDQAQQVSASWNVQQDQAAMETKAISEQQLHNDIGTRDQAVGAIAVDQAQIESAKLNLDYCQIKSPIDGRAGQRLVDVGNVVTAAGQASGTNLLSIQTLDPIYADFIVTESELLKVQQFMALGTLAVQVQLPGDVILKAGAQPATQPVPTPGAEYSPEKQHSAAVGLVTPEQVGAGPASAPAGSPATAPATNAEAKPVLEIPRVGQLTFLDNAVQDGTGTIKLRATLPNSDHHFWPGQFVNVRLVLMVQKGAVLIPNSATQISQKGPYVYVVQPDSTAALVPITLGQRQGDLVVVESGLQAGDQVVLTGQLMVMPGGKVMVVNKPPAAGAPGGAAAASAQSDDKSVTGTKSGESNGGSL